VHPGRTGQVTPQKDDNEEITGALVGKPFRRMETEGVRADQTLEPRLAKPNPLDLPAHQRDEPSQKTPMDMIPPLVRPTDRTNLGWIAPVNENPPVPEKPPRGELYSFFQQLPPQHPPLFSHPFPVSQIGNRDPIPG
jgi:hypothetical protein